MTQGSATPQRDGVRVEDVDREAGQALADRLCAMLRQQGADAPSVPVQPDGEIVQAFARHRLSAERAGWWGIESAPRDGTLFDVWMPSDEGGYRVADLYFSARGLLIRGGMPADLPRWPTHWQPLPAAPTDAETGA